MNYDFMSELCMFILFHLTLLVWLWPYSIHHVIQWEKRSHSVKIVSEVSQKSNVTCIKRKTWLKSNMNYIFILSLRNSIRERIWNPFSWNSEVSHESKVKIVTQGVRESSWEGGGGGGGGCPGIQVEQCAEVGIGSGGGRVNYGWREYGWKTTLHSTN